MTPRNWMLVALMSGFALAASNAAFAQQKEPTARQQQLAQSIHWQDGPCEGKIGSMATVKVPAGYHFTDASGAQAYMELLGNPPSTQTLGILKPVADETGWLIEFSYDSVGYVKDDEKDKIDANAILESIKTGTVEANKKRGQMGSAPLNVIGWETPPFYDSGTNRLSWAIRAQSEGQFVVNYNSRILGRGGVMSANLIIEPNDLQKTLPIYNQLLSGYSYVSGQRYSEFREGDRVAEYGLAAFVAGGAFAVAAKTGLLAKLLKPIIIGLVVLGGFFAKFYRKIFGKTEAST